MIDTELKDLIRKAYKAGRRNALKQDEANFNDFINKHESKLKLFAIPVVMQRSELLLFADYSESDKTSQTTDECVDNYLSQKSNSA